MSSKAERYFWQYNIQAKGPKGQRLVLKTKLEDPHVLNEVTDPVFSPSCSLRGIKHRYFDFKHIYNSTEIFVDFFHIHLFGYLNKFVFGKNKFNYIHNWRSVFI